MAQQRLHAATGHCAHWALLAGALVGTGRVYLSQRILGRQGLAYHDRVVPLSHEGTDSGTVQDSISFEILALIEVL